MVGAIEVVEMVGSRGSRWRWRRGRWWRWWEVGDRGGEGVVVDMIKGGGDGGQCGVEVAKGLGQQVGMIEGVEMVRSRHPVFVKVVVTHSFGQGEVVEVARGSL